MSDARSPLLDTVATLAPELSARATEAEAATTMPADLVAKTKAAGLFRLGLPKALGGWECDPLTMLDVISALARADGSAGLTIMIGNSTTFLARLEPDAAKGIIGSDVNISFHGHVRPHGQGGGRRERELTISGRWPFNSGCPHSEWLMAGVMVHDGEELWMVPPGRPDWRFAWFPRDH